MNWTKEQIREKLKVEHERENLMNKELRKLDNIISHAKKKKLKIAKKISSNMKYRNKLISML